jgi:hypothetical protein
VEKERKLDQPKIVARRRESGEELEWPLRGIEGALKEVGVKRLGPGAGVGVPPGDLPPRERPGEKALLGVIVEGDVVEEERLPLREERQEKSDDQGEDSSRPEKIAAGYPDQASHLSNPLAIGYIL